jgi:hypothetical protein
MCDLNWLCFAIDTILREWTFLEVSFFEEFGLRVLFLLK